ncbi:LysR family transcriptional regulator, partial [Klebsiella pneumoniae]
MVPDQKPIVAAQRLVRRVSMSDLKLFEDLIALAQTGSFVRAAELRHVTHP